MIPKRWIASYLRFLLRNRLAVTIVTAVMTIFFAYQCTHIKVLPQFLDFYPGPLKLTILGKEITLREGHPYIKIYNEFRRMFGSANVLTLIIEVKHGDIYNPTTLQKIDQATKALVETKGVVPVPDPLHRAPEDEEHHQRTGRDPDPRGVLPGRCRKTQEDAERVKFAVYSTKGIRGIYVSEDDTAALVTAGFWEEELDFDYLYDRMRTLKQQRRGRQPHRLHHRLPVAVHLDPALRPRRCGRCSCSPSPRSPSCSGTTSGPGPGIWVPIFSGIAVERVGARSRCRCSG